jgi:hypothetical protein
MKEMVKSVKLGMEVLNLGWSCLGTQSIHEKHLFWHENIVSVNPILRLHSQLVLKTKQKSKPSDCDLILTSVSYPHKLLSIDIKV